MTNPGLTFPEHLFLGNGGIFFPSAGYGVYNGQARNEVSFTGGLNVLVISAQVMAREGDILKQ